jgi:hypothetical protein
VVSEPDVRPEKVDEGTTHDGIDERAGGAAGRIVTGRAIDIEMADY